MRTSFERRPAARTVLHMAASAALLLATAAAATTPSAALTTYTSGDMIYVAYQSPSGPNYIVDLGPVSNILNATTPMTFPDVTASDLNGVIGASATNIFVGLFGVRNPSTRDGIFTANGPNNDVDLGNANVTGAVNQVDAFANGVVNLGAAVPSGNVHAAKFASSGSTGSYQSTLDAAVAGSLGNNIPWNVETQLSNASGVRNTGPVNIQVFVAIRNTFTGVKSRTLIGFFTLNPDGTVTYSPDADGDFIPDNIDLCPGVNSADNSDVDGDHHAPACDCAPTDPTAWSLPTAVVSLTFSNATTFAWTAPANLGGTAALYDVLRMPETAAGTAPAYACFQPNLAGLTSTDATNPAVGQVFLYLTRAGNSCGEGIAGTQTNGSPVPAPACP